MAFTFGSYLEAKAYAAFTTDWKLSKFPVSSQSFCNAGWTMKPISCVSVLLDMLLMATDQ
jgi:hypothetical protein